MHVINVHADSGEKVLLCLSLPDGNGGQIREGVLRLAVQLDELQERGAELGCRRQPERPRPHEVLPACAEQSDNSANDKGGPICGIFRVITCIPPCLAYSLNLTRSSCPNR